MASMFSMRSAKSKEGFFGWLFTIPFLLVFIVFQVYPMLYSFYLSVFTYNGFSPPVFVGLANFKRLYFHDTLFLKAVLNTVYIWLVCFVFQLFFSFLIAPIFAYSRIKGVSFWRSIFYFPNLVSSTVMAFIFGSLFSRDTGVINTILKQFGLIENPIPFFGTAIIAQAIVSFIIWMQYFGVFIIYISSSIAAIPTEVFDAAKIDGCTPSQAYFRITLPLLRPLIYFILITSLAGGLQIFEQPYFISGGSGAPDNNLLSMVMYLYRMAFSMNQLGYGASVGISVFSLILLGTILLVRVNSHFKNKYI
jgi:cellobiose transport system permease protein